jgi:hypothetical protein
MSKWKRFLLLGSLSLVLLAGLMFTSHTQGSRTAFASGCNNPATGSGPKPYYVPTWGNNCTISEGNISNYVYAIQEIINVYISFSGKCGPKLTLDGNFGPATFNAVECFQGHNGLSVDGIVGPKTWGVMENYPIVWGPDNGGWRNYSAYQTGYIDFRMWINSGIWYVYTGSKWCQMNLSSPC